MGGWVPRSGGTAAGAQAAVHNGHAPSYPPAPTAAHGGHSTSGRAHIHGPAPLAQGGGPPASLAGAHHALPSVDPAHGYYAQDPRQAIAYAQMMRMYQQGYIMHPYGTHAAQAQPWAVPPRHEQAAPSASHGDFWPGPHGGSPAPHGPHGLPGAAYHPVPAPQPVPGWHGGYAPVTNGGPSPAFAPRPGPGTGPHDAPPPRPGAFPPLPRHGGPGPPGQRPGPAPGAAPAHPPPLRPTPASRRPSADTRASGSVTDPTLAARHASRESADDEAAARDDPSLAGSTAVAVLASPTEEGGSVVDLDSAAPFRCGWPAGGGAPDTARGLTHARSLAEALHAAAAAESGERPGPMGEAAAAAATAAAQRGTTFPPLPPSAGSACGFVADSIAALEEHRRSDHGVAPAMGTSCPVCVRHCLSRSHLTRHTRTRHGMARQWLCGVCGRGFATASNRNAHVRTVHIRARPFTCPVCGKALSRRTHLRVHCRRLHRLDIDAPGAMVARPGSGAAAGGQADGGGHGGGGGAGGSGATASAGDAKPRRAAAARGRVSRPRGRRRREEDDDDDDDDGDEASGGDGGWSAGEEEEDDNDGPGRGMAGRGGRKPAANGHRGPPAVAPPSPWDRRLARPGHFAGSAGAVLPVVGSAAMPFPEALPGHSGLAALAAASAHSHAADEAESAAAAEAARTAEPGPAAPPPLDPRARGGDAHDAAPPTRWLPGPVEVLALAGPDACGPVGRSLPGRHPWAQGPPLSGGASSFLPPALPPSGPAPPRTASSSSTNTPGSATS